MTTIKLRYLPILLLITATFFNGCYEDANRNKDRSPAAQMDKDTVVHPDAKRDSAELTDPYLPLNQKDSPAGPNPNRR